MQRQQKTKEFDCPCEDKVEPESNKGVPSTNTLESEEKSGARNSELLERILETGNMNAAYLRVKQNKGSAGIDAMSVDELGDHLREHGKELLSSIQGGWYKPKAVKRVEIPKPNGGKRLLGVPTVVDRMVQQAMVQVLSPIFEETFSDNSYGFRPKRSAHQGIKKAKRYYEQGYTHVVDIDLTQYFDTVNHDILLEMVREQVKDERVIKLIRKFLQSGVMIDGLVSVTSQGTPQGGNLSPLLSNIYLTSFDRMLESRGHKFVRYADDCNIYVKSARAATRVMGSCVSYLEGKLKLKVNQEKSQVGSPLRSKFLGFSLYKVGKKVGIRPHASAIQRFKQRIRELTSRKQGKSVKQILSNLKTYTMGWLGYYAVADMDKKMQRLNEWIRRRIRQIFWKQWKGLSARVHNLMKLGMDKRKAWEWGNSRLGYWRVAVSWIMTRTVTNKYLASLGYDDIHQRYKMLHVNH